MINKDSFKYSCIFGGGAIRGVAYVGALKAMAELGIKPSTIAGSSVGAIFAGLVAVGYSEDEIKDIFLKVNFELFKDIHFGLGKGFALSKGEVFLEWIRELIEEKFYGENYKKGENPRVKFKDLEKNLIIITTDLTNFKPQEFSKFETPEFEIAKAIRISSTMPGLMTPYNFEGRELVDGDLQKSWPLWRLSKNICTPDERVLEFRLEGDFNRNGKNAIDYLNTVYSCVTSIATNFVIDHYGKRDKFDYIIINTGSTVIVDFNQKEEDREELINIGYEATMNYFTNQLPQKKLKLLAQYTCILKQLTKIKSALKKKNTLLIQKEFGNLFIHLCESKCLVDLCYLDKLKELKDKVYSNITTPIPFFGSYITGTQSFYEEISEIELDLVAKISELKQYKHIKESLAEKSFANS